MPWISNVPFPGLAYCLGGRSLFWGGWSPRLTAADLATWPADVAAYLTQGAGAAAYDHTKAEIGAVPTADFMLPGTFHDNLMVAFQYAITAQPQLTGVTDAGTATARRGAAGGRSPRDNRWLAANGR